MRWFGPLPFVALVALAPAGVTAADFVGAETCGTCHEKEYADWKATGHAAALARLSERQAEDAACRGCHTTAPELKDPKLTGVQCESCHGAGSLYAPRNVMRDEALSKLFGLEPVNADTCRPCHAPDTPSINAFVYERAVQLVNHSRARASAGDAADSPAGEGGVQAGEP